MDIINHPTQRVAIVDNVVPSSFVKATTMQKKFDIAKGALNKLRLRPEVLNEHVDSSREIQGVVDASTIVGQIFKASADNINGAYLTLSSAAGILLDDFESYASDAALQAVWIATGTLATVDTSVVYAGAQSMHLPGAALGDEWGMTFSAQDMTDFLGTIAIQQDSDYAVLKASVSVSDGTYTKRYNLVIPYANSWHTLDIDINAMTEDDPANPVNDAAITSISFRIEDKAPGSNIYIDHITRTAPVGSMDIKLWDMGTTLPTDGVTTLDSGTQYVTLGDISDQSPAASYNIRLVGGQRLYHLHYLFAGVAEEIPSNTPLNIGHYYALTLHYVDTDVNVWGPDTSFNINYYDNGYAFTAASEVAVMNGIGTYSDLMFGIFSTQDVYIYEISAEVDSVPGSRAEYHASIEDKNMTLTNIVHTHGVKIPQQSTIDTRYTPALLSKGGKFELDYGDDYLDSASEIYVSISYVYEPPVING